MEITNKKVKKTLEHFRDITIVTQMQEALSWDSEVNAPEKGADARAAHIEYLEKELVNKWNDKAFLDTLMQLEKEIDSLLPIEQTMVRNMLNSSAQYRKVPAELLIKRANVSSRAFVAWRKAKQTNDFKEFAPYLSELIEIAKLIAKHVGYAEHPLDVGIHFHAPGMTVAKVDALFTPLKKGLVQLLQDIKKSPAYKAENALRSGTIVYPEESQRKLSLYLMRLMGYDFAAGRLDVSPHPFTTQLGPGDVRITTRFKEFDFIDSLTATMHESGHALYEFDVNPEFAYTPLSHDVMFDMHEAMSRFWENMVGKNPLFISYVAPAVKATFPEHLALVNTQDLIMAFNTVKPSFIRIEADEVTYSLHIILRFEMEQGLLSGEISVEDAPRVWREKAKELFGIAPETDTEGILQDVHWSHGSFGYFPSYALGNLYGAQLLARMKKDLPFDEHVAKGELAYIRAWLRDMIHQYGSQYWSEELLEKATGGKPSEKYFLDYLREKYSKIYGI